MSHFQQRDSEKRGGRRSVFALAGMKPKTHFLESHDDSRNPRITTARSSRFSGPHSHRPHDTLTFTLHQRESTLVTGVKVGAVVAAAT